MAVESPGAFNEAPTYGAEQTRRATGFLYQQPSAGAFGQVAGGVRAAGELVLTAPGSGMSVNVGTGECVVPGSSSSTQGGYYGLVTSVTNLAVAASDASKPRVDLVYAVVTDSEYSGVTDTFAVAVATGTPTVGATLVNLTGAPAVPTSALAIGYVLVPATSTNVTAGNLSTTVSQVLSTAMGFWTNLTLGTGVTSATTGPTPGSRNENAYICRLKGTLKNTSGGAIGSGTTIATIASASQFPLTALFLAAYTSTPTACALEISLSGVITLSISWPNNALVGLEGITYSRA